MQVFRAGAVVQGYSQGSERIGDKGEGEGEGEISVDQAEKENMVIYVVYAHIIRFLNS